MHLFLLTQTGKQHVRAEIDTFWRFILGLFSFCFSALLFSMDSSLHLELCLFKTCFVKPIVRDGAAAGWGQRYVLWARLEKEKRRFFRLLKRLLVR